ncbi:MAG: histidine triad nucleotide-binding protein [Proteobacteria bacterium]|nr:histidine triad nucleotide-binding protein [Pseudomonadota bacterium]
MMDCIFCKIVKGDIPATVEYETDELIVINDLNPQAPVHLLVIPKTHYSTLLDCDEAVVLGGLLEGVKEIAIRKGFADAGFRTVINTNKGGGQSVFHLHLHILAGKGFSESIG